MKNSIIIIICISLFLACKSEPKLVLDLKNINKLDTVRSFTIKNSGNKPLIIENFTTSCECTVINLKKNQTISPNEIIKVGMKVEKSKVGTGNFIYLTIKTNAIPRLTSFRFKL